MKKQKLILHSTGNRDRWRAIIKTRHARLIYIELSIKGNRCKIVDCYYVDRIRGGKYYATPKKLVTREFAVSSLLDVISRELDRKYFGIEYRDAYLDSSTEEFISAILSDMRRGYRFLIFVVEGKPDNTTFPVLKTRFKNKLHRSIYLELHISGGKVTVADCWYFDREYTSREKAVPPMLLCIKFDYSKNGIIKLVNEELCGNFTDILFISDGSIDISKPIPICGNIH